MADNKVNSGLLEFSEDQKVFVALDAETSEVKKAVTIDGDGVETDIQGVQPSGKKEITSTAEVNVANYATAQVVDEDLIAGNIKKDVDILGVVGSYEPEAPASDFSTAQVTVTGIPGSGSVDFLGFCCEGDEDNGLLTPLNSVANDTYLVPLYKGKAIWVPSAILTIVVSGDAELDTDGIFITGDCTITISN